MTQLSSWSRAGSVAVPAGFPRGQCELCLLTTSVAVTLVGDFCYLDTCKPSVHVAIIAPESSIAALVSILAFNSQKYVDALSCGASLLERALG